MKFARVIGRCTFSVVDPAYKGGRFLLAIPCGPQAPAPVDGQALPAGNSFVVFDEYGATDGDLIAYTDSGEAAVPFAQDTPCDAYCSAILNGIFWEPYNKGIEA